MVQSVLGSLVLGYRPLWGRSRRLAGVQLYAQNEANTQVDASHLLRTLRELWSANSPPLLLSPLSRQLLCTLLEQAPRGTPWIEVRGEWLADSTILQLTQKAHQRGLKLVWRGDVGHLPEPDIARCFDNSLLSLRPQDVVNALQSMQPPKAGKTAPASSPVLGGQMYEGIANRALMSHCLDQHSALALAGWPIDDVLYSMRHHPQQASQTVVMRLLKAIDAEQSLDTFEDIMGEDPLLCYRFITYTNSASLGLRTGIDSIRRGLVMMGYASMRRWLAEQLPHTCTEPDMHPVRQSMVIRAALTAQLLNAGVENDLRREVYLCGLLSQLDLLLQEPTGAILRRVPLSSRLYDAIILETGPYAGALHMACALENDDASAIRQRCHTFEMDLEEVNRGLLRVLSDLRVARSAATQR